MDESRMPTKPTSVIKKIINPWKHLKLYPSIVHPSLLLLLLEMVTKRIERIERMEKKKVQLTINEYCQ